MCRHKRDHFESDFQVLGNMLVKNGTGPWMVDSEIHQTQRLLVELQVRHVLLKAIELLIYLQVRNLRFLIMFLSS